MLAPRVTIARGSATLRPVTLALRPSFSVELSCPSREAIARLVAALGAGHVELRRSRVPGGGRDAGPRDKDFLVLTVPAAEQRFWSPWLTIDIAPLGALTRVHARFGPHPSIWTGFAFGYLTLGVVLAVSLVVAASGALVPGSEQRWAWWLAAGTVLALASLWAVSRLGVHLARTQMEQLRRELERALSGCTGGREPLEEGPEDGPEGPSRRIIHA